MDTKVILVALAAVVIIAGVAFVAIGGEDEEELKYSFEADLPVFGNANNDGYINNDDIEKIKEIKDGAWDKAQNRYADANCDGAVDDADIKFVEDMMAKKEMRIFYTNCFDTVQSVQVPIDKYLITGYEAMYGVQIVDRHADAVGRDDMPDMPMFAGLKDKVFNKTIYANAEKIARSPFSLDMGLTTQVMEKQQGLGHKVTALFTSGHYCEKNEAQLNKLGVDVIRTDVMDMNKVFPSVMLMGYILDNEEKSNEFCSFMNGFWNDVRVRIDGVPDAQKQEKCLLNVWGTTLFSDKSDDSKVMEIAGCVNALKADMIGGLPDKAIDKGADWHLGTEFNVPHMIVKGQFKYESTYEDYANLWKTGMEAASWDKMMKDHYMDGIVIINYQVQPIMLVSYMAEYLHPDAFYDGFTDEYHQQMVDRFFPDLKEQNYKVSEHPFSMDYEDLKPYL